MSNKVSIEFTGDTSDVIREVDDATRAMGRLEDAADDVDRAGKGAADGLGQVGEAADVGEQRIMGARDTIDGLATIMQGPGEQGISSYLQGWADLGSGIFNFVVPALQAATKATFANIKSAIAGGAAHVKNAALMTAGWIKMGVQSLLSAAKVAAAWLISIGPIAIVIAAVVGLVVIIVKNWDKIKEFLTVAWNKIKEIAVNVWNGIKDFFKGALEFVKNLFLNWTGPGLLIKHWDKIKEGATKVKDWIVEKFTAMLDWFKSLPGKMTSAISGLFDGLKSTFRSAINWLIDKWNAFSLGIDLPSILGGGRISIETPNIPRFHSGGVFNSGRGEGLARLRDGEGIFTPAQMRALGGGGAQTINLLLDKRIIAQVVRDELGQIKRRNGNLGLT